MLLPRACGPLLLCVGGSLLAQTFDYPNFASTAGLTLNGGAAAVTNQLRVSNNVAGDVGSVWRTTPVPVREGFETRFDFSITSASEGLAFVIHGAPSGAGTLGGSLWGMGYGFGANTAPIVQSLAIEIDAIQDTFLNDTSNNEVSIHTVGVWGNSENESVSIARATPTVDLSNNAVHTLRVRYVPGVGAPGTLSVFVDTATTPLLSIAYSFETGANQLSGGNNGGLGLPTIDAWVGFTSASPSGVSGQNAAVRSWSWVSYHLPNACYTGNVFAGAGGPYDLLRVNGSAGGFFRTMNLTVGDPFTIAMQVPPGVPSAPFLLFGTIGIADTATVTATPYGNACFPLSAPIAIGSSVAPYQLAVPPGLLLAVPLTLQAVMAPSAANPSLIEITNAVGMQFSFAPAPAITTIAPNSATVGATITVTGTNFSPFVVAELNGNPLALLSSTATQITFAMPAGTPCGSQLRVRNPDGAFVTAPFNPTPTISQQLNATGPAVGGTTYIVVGTGFAPGCTATIGGIPATVTTSASTVVTMLTPPSTPGAKPVVITTPGGCSVTGTFTYF